MPAGKNEDNLYPRGAGMEQRGDSTPMPIGYYGFEVVTQQANDLMELLDRPDVRGKWVMRIRGQAYLKYEAWLTVARFNGMAPIIEWTEPVVNLEGQVIGYESRAKLVRLDTGTTIATGEAMCGVEERSARGQNTEMGRRNAARSMAQTRSASKAMRLHLAYVVVLAGFQGTSAEEIDDVWDNANSRADSGGITIGDDPADSPDPPADPQPTNDARSNRRRNNRRRGKDPDEGDEEVIIIN